jgi:hypothetical protein
MLNGYKFQEVQRATIQLQKDKIDEVAYTNKLLSIFITKVSVTDPDTGNDKSIASIPDVLTHILEQGVEVLDELTDYIQQKMEELQSEKKTK